MIITRVNGAMVFFLQQKRSTDLEVSFHICCCLDRNVRWQLFKDTYMYMLNFLDIFIDMAKSVYESNWQDTQLLTLLLDYCFLYCRIFNINIALRELIVVCIAGVFQVKSDIQPNEPTKKLCWQRYKVSFANRDTRLFTQISDW